MYTKDELVINLARRYRITAEELLTGLAADLTFYPEGASLIIGNQEVYVRYAGPETAAAVSAMMGQLLAAYGVTYVPGVGFTA